MNEVNFLIYKERPANRNKNRVPSPKNTEDIEAARISFQILRCFRSVFAIYLIYREYIYIYIHKEPGSDCQSNY